MAAYYILNMAYPAEASATLDFVQRYEHFTNLTGKKYRHLFQNLAGMCHLIRWQQNTILYFIFVNRCLLLINPEKGNKAKTKRTKKVCGVHPKVLELISKMADFEWTV